MSVKLVAHDVDQRGKRQNDKICGDQPEAIEYGDAIEPMKAEQGQEPLLKDTWNISDSLD